MYNLKNIVRPNIWDLQPYSSARDEFSGDNAVYLDANENPFGELNRYPDPYQKQLKKQLSARKSIPTENIFIGNGSDEVIDLAFRIFCIPGVDKAMTFSPSYGMYDVSAAINAVEFIKFPLNPEFQIETEDLGKILTDKRLKLIFICSPNNPTGNLIETKSIEFILDNFNGILLIDEAYMDFSASESWISKLKNYPNLIVCQTFSKAWGLAAARVGTAYASCEIISLFNKVKPPYNVSAINQQATLNALNNPALYEANKQVILSEKTRLINALKQLNQVVKTYPSDANFLLVEVTDATRIYADLIAQSVVTRNRNNVIENCIRITVGTPEENNALIEALKIIESKDRKFAKLNQIT
jgi:histidinol-phosphate aminotransferase